MAQHSGVLTEDAVSALRRWQRRPLAIYAAGAWSVLYAVLAIYWAFGGAGFPFGFANDPGAALSVLAGVTSSFATTIAVSALAGVAVAAGMLAAPRSRPIRYVLQGFAFAAAAVLALLVPDYRVLVALAYTPILLAGAPFGWPAGVNLSEAYPWPVLNQMLCSGGGLLWAAAAVQYGRRARAACLSCGRVDAAAGWTSPEATARWGRWAVGIAVLIPGLYAITRWAWALGIPLGISREFLREGQALGMWWAGAALATLAVGGALLTLGLVQRWGEKFPRWIPFVGGKPVPPALAIVPASLVTVAVTSAGLMFVRLWLSGTIDAIFGPEASVFDAENWATLAPELLWPLWGAALGAATLAYSYRRRGRCRVCGRGFSPG